LPIQELSTTFDGVGNNYQYNGKELNDDFGLHWMDYGARWYDTQTNRWGQVDPLAEKYYAWSGYNYVLGNPVKLIDPDGREIWITHGNEKIKYENGKLYGQDGNPYSGRGVRKDGSYKGFLRETVRALDAINKSQEGSEMINELQSSNNVFMIRKSGKSEFKSDNVRKSHAKQWQTDPTLMSSYNAQVDLGIDFKGGSGGIIQWNPVGSSIWEEGGNQSTRPFVDLAHEMFHGLDANRGMLNDQFHEGVKMSEWQAVYRENILRQDLKIPLRTHYIDIQDPSGKSIGSGGPSMIDKNNQPIKPSTY